MVYFLRSWSLFLGLSLLAVVLPAYAADPKKPAGAAPAAPAAAPTPPLYERICQVDVSYFYRPLPRPGYDPVKSDPNFMTKVYFTTLSEQGMIIEDVQIRLNNRLASVRSQAIETCRGEHQEESGCVTKRLAALAQDYPSIDFLRRQMVFEAIRTDCANTLGTCLATQSSEVRCWMNIPPEVAVPNEPKIEIVQPQLTEPPIDGMEGEEDTDGVLATESDLDEATPEQQSDVGQTIRKTNAAKQKPKKRKVGKISPADDIRKAPDGQVPGGGFNQPFSLP